jgi:riboflavin synthase
LIPPLRGANIKENCKKGKGKCKKSDFYKMFTGIIETTGKINSIETAGSNLIFWIESSISTELAVDQSLSHSGVCLTVEETKGSSHRVSAINETLLKTNLQYYKSGDIVNLERCIRLNGRLDGHIVQGHVDTVGTCLEKQEHSGSWLFRFQFDEQFAPLIIEKGSICINGISLTAFDVTNNELTVAIIPYTFNHTNIHTIEQGSPVNIEFDLIGKYIQRWEQIQKTASYKSFK